MPRILDRARVLLAAVAGIGAAAGCDDPTTIRASFNNVEREVVVYAMNGSEITRPAALGVRTVTPVRIDAGFGFDVAFDINDSGFVEVYTQGRVASQLVATRRVGLQYGGQPYPETIRAPVSGYVYDSSLVAPAGRVVFVDVIEQQCSGSFLGANIRAKIRVDSVNASTRAIHMHVLANPNCGFRSLVLGEPRD